MTPVKSDIIYVCSLTLGDDFDFDLDEVTETSKAKVSSQQTEEQKKEEIKPNKGEKGDIDSMVIL